MILRQNRAQKKDRRNTLRTVTIEPTKECNPDGCTRVRRWIDGHLRPLLAREVAGISPWISIEERDIFLATCREHRPDWFPFFFTAFHTGMRMGELKALRWEDLQFNAKIPFIRVRRSSWRGHEKTTKTGKARSVPMNSALTEVLKAHRHLRGSLVFYNSAGQPLDINGGRKVLKWVCRRAGLRSIRLHEIRHSFCSHAAEKSGDLNATKDLAGHSELTTTAIYLHSPTKRHQEVVEALVTPSDGPRLFKSGDEVATEVATDENEGRKSGNG